MTRFTASMLLLWCATLVAAQEDPRSEIPDDMAILFPWFSEALGLVTFFLLTRYFPALPFTAFMFVLGACMGIGATRLLQTDDLTLSILTWTGINSELLLRSFLPGLLWGDAFGLSPHLFEKAFWQLIIFAFPMVLAGTALTALVCYYIFPYGWSWNLSMTVGSILAATDPVAVCALLESLGAPPRLKLHISGESMLNDGSAYVFYVIFSSIYLSELGTKLGIPGVGETYTTGSGFANFFQLSCGGAAIGTAFGLGQDWVLYMLNRRLNSDENVLQVVSTITFSYLAYYVADIAGCSGVLSVVMLGITTKAFGNPYINDHELLENFWTLVEQLLNTLLFALAGVIWGSIIGNPGPVLVRFTGKDWGYLIMFYVLLNCIRCVILAGAYPFSVHLGLSTNIKEQIFSAFGGLRGAVAVSLALALNADVREAGEEAGQPVDEFQAQTQKAFAMIGGIAFFTLVVNGTMSGPLLKKLGLVKPTDTRVRLLKDFRRTAKAHVTDDFVRLLADPRFRDVDFSVVKAHVSMLEDLTLEELEASVGRNKGLTPNLDNTIPYLSSGGKDLSWVPQSSQKEETEHHAEIWGSVHGRKDDDDVEKTMVTSGHSAKETELNLLELRLFFLEALRAVYNRRIEQGELDGREGFVAYILLLSLDFSEERVNNGEPLNDWDVIQEIRDTNRFSVIFFIKLCWIAVLKIFSKETYFNRGEKKKDQKMQSHYYLKLKREVHGQLVFIDAHRSAQRYFRGQFAHSSGEFRPEVEQVINESESQVQAVKEALLETDKEDLQVFVSHVFCGILLSKIAKYSEKLFEEGILQEREVTAFLDTLDEEVIKNHTCGELEHPGKVTTSGRAQQEEYVGKGDSDDDDEAMYTPAQVVEEPKAASSGRGRTTLDASATSTTSIPYEA